MKNKSEINKQIALLLGFEIRGITVNGEKNARLYWHHPEILKNQQCSSPENTLPDFVGILEHLISAERVYQTNILKKDYDSYPLFNDLVDDLVKGVPVGDDYTFTDSCGCKFDDRINVPLSPNDVEGLYQIFKSKAENSSNYVNQKRYHKLSDFFESQLHQYHDARSDFDSSN